MNSSMVIINLKYENKGDKSVKQSRSPVSNKHRLVLILNKAYMNNTTTSFVIHNN